MLRPHTGSLTTQALPHRGALFWMCCWGNGTHPHLIYAHLRSPSCHVGVWVFSLSTCDCTIAHLLDLDSASVAYWEPLSQVVWLMPWGLNAEIECHYEGWQLEHGSECPEELPQCGGGGGGRGEKKRKKRKKKLLFFFFFFFFFLLFPKKNKKKKKPPSPPSPPPPRSSPPPPPPPT